MTKEKIGRRVGGEGGGLALTVLHTDTDRDEDTHTFACALTNLHGEVRQPHLARSCADETLGFQDVFNTGCRKVKGGWV